MTLLRCLWLIGLLISGCTSAEVPPPTATTLRVIQATLVPTVNRPLHAVASLTPETFAPTLETCQSTAALPTTQHTVTAEIDYGQHYVSVQQHVRTINRGSDSFEQVVFDLEANRFPGVVTLAGVQASQVVLGYELTGRRLTLDLAAPVRPGCALEVDLAYSLHVQPVGRGVSGYTGYLGYTNRQFNLGQWLASLAERRGGEWITHDSIVIGEQTVVETADWDVTLAISSAPNDLVVAAPGTVVEQGGGKWRYTLAHARDFTVSMSPFYRVMRQTAAVGGGVQVELYTFQNEPAPQGGVDSAGQAMEAAAQAMAMYSDLFGAYDYERFVVIQGDFPDGMEFSGLVFVSDQWFSTNNGTPQSYLTIITVHETAHQWWYARVGSDQALTPWLDEALATYSEYIFFEEHYPDLKDWWWNFRVDTFVPANYTGARVNSTVYQFASARDYINAVYLRGAQMLDALRGALGTETFFDWLRRYADAGKDRIVTPDELWSLLTPEQLAATVPIRAAYFAPA